MGGRDRKYAFSGRSGSMFETGHFSQLWRQVAEKFGIQVEYVPGNWRRGVAAADVTARLAADDGAF